MKIKISVVVFILILCVMPFLAACDDSDDSDDNEAQTIAVQVKHLKDEEKYGDPYPVRLSNCDGTTPEKTLDTGVTTSQLLEYGEDKTVDVSGRLEVLGVGVEVGTEVARHYHMTWGQSIHRSEELKFIADEGEHWEWTVRDCSTWAKGELIIRIGRHEPVVIPYKFLLRWGTEKMGEGDMERCGQKLYTLNMNVNGTGSTSPEVGAYDYNEGDVALIKATPGSGWHFDYWSGGVADHTSATTTVVMDSNKNVIAHFKAMVTLTIGVEGNGTTSPSPGSYRYNEGQQVTITATPYSGYSFNHWTGDAPGTSPSVTITMDRNMSITAHFKAMVTLTISVSGQGTTSPSPGSYTYDDGQRVTITASPLSGYSFDHWGGDASDTSPSITITMDGNKSVTAYFEEVSLGADLTITTGSPTVKPSTVAPGGTVSLSAWTVKNQGDANSGSFSNGVYLSTDSVITASDTYLTGNSNSNLAPGAQFNWGGQTLTIPKGTPSGNYYFGILVDRTNVVFESNEKNNYVVGKITVSPPW